MQRVFTLHLNPMVVNINPGVLTFPVQGLTSIKIKLAAVKTLHAADVVRNLVKQGNSPNTKHYDNYQI